MMDGLKTICFWIGTRVNGDFVQVPVEELRAIENRLEELEQRCEERMAEILRAKEIIDRLTGQRERFYSALNKMVSNESMVETAHAKAGQPYFNVALTEARAALEEIR